MVKEVGACENRSTTGPVVIRPKLEARTTPSNFVWALFENYSQPRVYAHKSLGIVIGSIYI